MNKRSSISFASFLEAIALGKPILDTLRLLPSEFTHASHDELLNNPDDIGSGVIKVEKKFDTLFFDVFTTLLVKHHDDGVTRYVFFGITRDAGLVIRLSRLLFEKFGNGIYDSDNYTSLRATEKINSLARGKYITPKDSLMNVWLSDKYNVSLGYSIDPMRGLVLHITEKIEREPDVTVRSNGTVADILHLDLSLITKQLPLDVRPTIEQGVLKFTDYYYRLDRPALDVFDILRLRVFGLQPEFTPQAMVNVDLTTSDIVSFEQMLPIIERLIKMYGADHIGSGELSALEIDELQKNAYWLGRMWHLNEAHALWQIGAEGERNIYTVALANNENDNGFTLYIIGYNEMIDQFGGAESALEVVA